MKRYYLFIFNILFCFGLFSQSNFSFSGDLQINGQTFQEDLSIGAEKREPNINSYLNLILDYKNYLKIGTRLELYRNPIPGFENYEGEGIAYKFVQFQKWNFDITLGNFYDQFGSGVLFRSYFDQNLGIDNSVNGARLKFKPSTGIDLTAIIGKQRNYWELGEGMIRGFDAQIYVNDYFFKKSRTTINLGGSFVTKKQKDNDPFFILPENVGAWSGRMNISKGRWNFESEYAYKINDPSFTNNYIYKNGNSIKISSVILLMFFSTFYSCEQEEIDGCMNESACNYNNEATNDDNSCQIPINEVLEVIYIDSVVSGPVGEDLIAHVHIRNSSCSPVSVKARKIYNGSVV